MQMWTTLAQSLGIAFAAGISPYATVALLGLATRMHWIGPLPGVLEGLSHPLIIALAGFLATIEFLATLVPGVAAAWETVHSAIRPPAAALMAVLTAWHGDALLILAAAVLGGGLGLATHATKLGLRYAIDTSPEPVSNGAANVLEWSIIGSLTYFIWRSPWLALGLALLLLILALVLVRVIWRTLRGAFATLFRVDQEE
jgi:Domain of unknown function (DUF4126)